MDREKFLELMKNLQSIMKCPSCGSLYNVDEIQLVGGQEGYFLLSMTCSKCSLPVWVNFFSGQNGLSRAFSDVTPLDFELIKKEAITTDEVVSFHNFISHFSGDFKKHLKK